MAPHVTEVTPSASAVVHENDLVTLTFDAPIVLGEGQVFVGLSRREFSPLSKPLPMSLFLLLSLRVSSQLSASPRSRRDRWCCVCPQEPCDPRRVVWGTRSSVCRCRTPGEWRVSEREWSDV